MERKLTERRIVGLLVILLVIEIALLGLHLGWGGFHWNSRGKDAQIAGHVSRSENELRRRGNNSLVWEKSGADDAVYFYDSILTLAQSTASLQLYRDTEVKLSENTLVTIEPQDKKGASGEIRLKFVKGSLKARNPFVTTKLESETWSMEIKSGSDVDFRQVGEDGFELEVSKGEVAFKSATGEATVTGSEMLKIKSDGAEKIAIDESLKWVDPPANRIYTHQDGETVKLKWQSNARELVVQTLGQTEQVIALEGRQSYDLPLRLGRHQIFLRGDQKTSPALSLEIWKAPLLHLVAPLPRNRVRSGEKTAFLWMTSPEVKSYDFVLRGSTLNLRKTVGENSFSTSLDREDDAEWSVEGRDADGFSIPPLYTYPLYIREAPLAAPKLRAPTLRRPAKAEDRGASFWWNQIFPRAAADEIQYQAVFNWEKVDGADRYVIEISETPDFRKPLVAKTVNAPEFVWKKMELKTYYWRVAAETRGGRLGIFSDPEKIDLQNGDQTGVAVMPLESPRHEPRPPPKEEPVLKFGSEEPREKIEKAPEQVDLKPKEAPAPPPIERFELKSHTFVEWTPGYSLLSIRAPEKVSASLSGGSLTAFAIGADRNYAAEKMARLQLNYARFKFKPSPQEKYPDQGTLTWSEISFTAVLHKSYTHWGYGLFLKRGADLVRESPTSVTMRAANEVGPAVQSYFSARGMSYVGDYIGMVGSDYGVATRQALRFKVFDGFYLGLQLDGAMLFRSGAQVNTFSGQALLGYDF